MRVIAMVVVCLFCVSQASAQRMAAVSAADWQVFVEESFSRYRQEGAPLSMEDKLFARADGATMRQAIARFAQDIDTSEPVAAEYAFVIVEAVKYHEACSERRDCVFGPGTALYDLAADVGMREPTGDLLASVGINLQGFGQNLDNEIAFLRLATGHPAAANIHAALFAYTEDAIYLAALTAAGPLTEAHAQRLASASAPDAGPDQVNGWFYAFVAAAEEINAQSPPMVRAALAQIMLNSLLGADMPAAAVERYYAYPDDVRALLPVGAACIDCRDRAAEIGRGAAQTLADELAAALWSSGHRDEALALVNRGIDAFGPREEQSRARYRALAESIQPTMDDDTLYQRFIIGDLHEELDDRRRARERESGALLQLWGSSDTLLQLVADRVGAANYPVMLEYVRSMVDREFEIERIAMLPRAAFLSDRAAALQPAWAERLSPPSVVHHQSQAVGELHVSTRPLEPWWREEALPAGLAPWGEEREGAHPPQGLDLPVPAEAVIRYERSGSEHALLYQSSQYDVPGEVPSYGIWFARTEGGEWQRPVYLGLQTYFPYVPTQGSRVPMLDGDTLQIEVMVREIDPGSITFPPVGLSVSRSVDGRLLVMDLNRVRSDQDQDGLTDIEERRIGLAFDRADSDGDGMNDSADPMPLTRFDPNAPLERRRLGEAILNQIMGHDAGAIIIAPSRPDTQLSLEDEILRVAGNGARTPPSPVPTVFLSGDPDMFAGIQSRVRFVVYSPRDIEELGHGSAPFYPPGVSWVFTSRDGRTHYVVWSASWVGGEFIVRCPAGSDVCETHEVSSWIT